MLPIIPVLILLILSGRLPAEMQIIAGMRGEAFVASRALDQLTDAELSQILSLAERATPSAKPVISSPEEAKPISGPATVGRVCKAYTRNERSRDGPSAL